MDTRLLDSVKLVDRLQRDAGITGDAAEIGVFHGKFLLALANLLDPGGKVTALDVFEDQARTLDGAGVGSLDRVQANVELYAPPGLDFAYIQADSSTLTTADRVDLVRTRGPFRLFSVDGCHTTEHTLADLRTAEDCLSPGGVIILDDYMQPHWPGVTAAVHLFCASVCSVRASRGSCRSSMPTTSCSSSGTGGTVRSSGRARPPSPSGRSPERRRRRCSAFPWRRSTPDPLPASGPRRRGGARFVAPSRRLGMARWSGGPTDSIVPGRLLPPSLRS